MKFEEVQTYFKKFVQKYIPYNGDRVYDIIITYLVNKYLSDQYTIIPEGLKTLYEDNILAETVFNQLLFAVGVHEEVIKKLKTSEKRLFLSALSDFQRYKGSVDYFRKVGQVYKDKFNVYELYVDYSDGSWILRPYMIYEGVKVKKEIQNIPYEVAYRTVPTLFVSEEQLDYYRDNNLAAFPLKTNLLSLQYVMETYVSEMINLALATFMKEYGDTYINIYHQDDSFSFRLREIYWIWFWLLSKYYGQGMPEFNLTRILLYQDAVNPYSMTDIDLMFDEYDKLEHSDDAYNFYKKYFLDVFETYHKADAVPLTDIEQTVFNINKNYLNYILSRIEDPELIVNKKLRTQTYYKVMNEIYDSLLLYLDDATKTGNQSLLFIKYFELFLESLNHILVDPKDTVSYLLMYNFKPYHTELLTEAIEVLVIEDKLDMISGKDSQEFLFNLIRVDYLNSMTDYIDYFEFILNLKDYFPIIDVPHYHFDLKLVEDMSIEFHDNITTTFKYVWPDFEEIEVYLKHSIIKPLESPNAIVDIPEFNIEMPTEEILINETSDIYERHFDYEHVEQIGIASQWFIPATETTAYSRYNKINDNTINKINKTQTNIINITDEFEVVLT